MAIPKILHYCWFGNAKMSKIEEKCVNRWKKYFHNYEIMKWEENNFDISMNKYVEQAYNCGRYAYVSDVARLKALYDYGGIYLDVDCKVVKSFDELLNCHAFTGFGADNRELAACTLAFEKGDPFIKECLDSYNDDLFLMPDGTMNLRSINLRMTSILETYGFIKNGEMQIVNNIIIYPMNYFCPLSMLPDEVKDCVNKDTYSMALWTNKELLRERSLVVRFAHKTGLNKIKRKVFGK